MISSALSGLASATAALTKLAEQHGAGHGTATIDDCPTPYVKFPGGHPPPPPPPFDRFIKVDLHPAAPVRADDGWCGTVPHKFPFPPPPPPPWGEGLGTTLGR